MWTWRCGSLRGIWDSLGEQQLLGCFRVRYFFPELCVSGPSPCEAPCSGNARSVWCLWCFPVCSLVHGDGLAAQTVNTAPQRGRVRHIVLVCAITFGTTPECRHWAPDGTLSSRCCQRERRTQSLLVINTTFLDYTQRPVSKNTASHWLFSSNRKWSSVRTVVTTLVTFVTRTDRVRLINII